MLIFIGIISFILISGSSTSALPTELNMKLWDLFDNNDTLEDTKIWIHSRIIYHDDKKKSSVRVICSSSRVPYQHHAEFLINNISAAFVKFDPNSNRCYSAYGVCNPNNCNCSQTGNSFSAEFAAAVTNETVSSCQMMFKDNMTGSIFTKTAALFLNQSGTFTLPTETTIIRNPLHRPATVSTSFGKGSTTESTHTSSFSGPLGATALSMMTGGLVIAVAMGIVVTIYVRRRKKHLPDSASLLP